jgi:hypothetical protein
MALRKFTPTFFYHLFADLLFEKNPSNKSVVSDMCHYGNPDRNLFLESVSSFPSTCPNWSYAIVGWDAQRAIRNFRCKSGSDRN